MNRRTSIVLTSVLKPVDDTRMFEKFGLSMSQTNKYDVNIIGFDSKNKKKIKNINFHPLFRFGRISIGRLLAPLRLFIFLFKVKPEVIIFNTPELLPVIIIYRLFARCGTIYDIQENYFRNIFYNNNYSVITRAILAYIVSWVELIGYPYTDRAILAEEGYRKELPLWNKKSIVIRNSYCDMGIKSPVRSFPKDNLLILYSGTISENYGIFRAIEFVDRMHDIFPEICLQIAGYCANKKTLRKVKDILKGKSYINLAGGEEMVPHSDIIRYIQGADYGIICYEINPSTENCFPTKIYEYMANKLPMIIQNYKSWSSYCLKHDAAIELDFDHVDYQSLYIMMNQESFYRFGIPGEIFWNEDEKKLLDWIDELLT